MHIDTTVSVDGAKLIHPDCTPIIEKKIQQVEYRWTQRVVDVDFEFLCRSVLRDSPSFCLRNVHELTSGFGISALAPSVALPPASMQSSSLARLCPFFNHKSSK